MVVSHQYKMNQSQSINDLDIVFWTLYAPCVCVCVCVCTRMFVCVSMCMRAHVHAHAGLCICMCVCVFSDETCSAVTQCVFQRVPGE